jgi:uncharacterized protein (TIGR00251 family)
MSKAPAYRWQNDNLLLNVYIQPNAPRDDYAGLYNSCIKLKIKASPVDGKANKELLRFLGLTFAVPPSRIRLIQGEGSRYKKIEICNPEELPEWIVDPPYAKCAANTRKGSTPASREE